MNQIEKKYIILGGLCALLLTLVVGYAAFSTILKIKGTSTINSNWDVQITNVVESNKKGLATTKDKSEGQDKTLCKNELCNPAWDGLTASFEVDLVSPGDSIEYVITVSNEGTLDAKLDNIVVSDSGNEYITFETSGLSINDALAKKTSKDLTVKVTYKDVTIENSKPSVSNLTVTLDFSQADGSGIIEPTPSNIVYRWTTDNLKIGDSIEGVETTKNPTTLNKNHYLKHEIDSENKIVASYACFVTDVEHCMQGGDGGVAYEINKTILQNQTEWFRNNDGLCHAFDSSTFYCIGNGFGDISAWDDGGANTFIESGAGCAVYPNGSSYCSISTT